jgi:flavodoxin
MDAIVIYESIYGNTRAVAQAIAEGIGGVPALPVHEAAQRYETLDLLVVGGPTHMHGLATKRSRQVAAEAAAEDGTSHIEQGATAGPGLRSWLRDLAPSAARHAAAFDTRLDKSPWMTGAAAHAIARRLRRRGLDVVATESFLVEDTEGPLNGGELDRARAWGAELARSHSVAAEKPLGAHS